jgi:hypothetical protein
MDSEFANARRIWGCAGIETVNGICEIAMDGATAITLEDQHTSNVQHADASVCAKRPCGVFDISLCIIKFLKDLWANEQSIEAWSSMSCQHPRLEQSRDIR